MARLPAVLGEFTSAVAPDVWIVVRTTGAGPGRVVIQTAPPTAAPPTTSAAVAIAAPRSHPAREAVAGSVTTSAAGTVNASSISNHAPAASGRRRFRSFSRQRRSNRRIDAGVSGGSLPQSGSARSTATSVSLMSSPAKARALVSIS